MAFMSTGLLMAYPILSPAIDLDFENVLVTTRLSYLSISANADSPPKSIYASSTITIESLL